MTQNYSLDDAGKMFTGYAYWYGTPTLLGCEMETDPTKADIALVGNPLSFNLVERTQYLGPRAVRHRSNTFHRMHREFQVDPFELARIRDFGDVPMVTWALLDQVVLEVEHFYAKLDAGGGLPFTIGGDHSITLPVLRAIAGPNSRRKAPIGMIHFDSHTDTYGPIFGVTHHAGAGFKIGYEEGLIDPRRCVQVGMNGPLADLRQDDYSTQVAGYRTIPLAEIQKQGIQATIKEIRRIIGAGPTYISFDLDVLTLPDAPAVANPEAGGLTINEVFQMFIGFRALDVVGGDIACFVPSLDPPSMITAIHANAIMHHIVTLMAEFVVKKRVK